MLGLSKRSWRSLRSDSDLTDELVAMMQSIQGADVAAIARRAHLPENEVAASPFGLRAVAMGVSTGATHVHRELTRVPTWEGDERMAGEGHDEWKAGVLQTGKYQAFIQDGAHSLFDPSHIAKWGPHELMHRACGFFWREDATAFELYVGARLNEVLPVALWYGVDQVARLEEREFVRHKSEHEVGRAAWRDADAGQLAKLARRSAHRVSWFAAYLEGELAAIDEEIRSGQCVVTPIEVGGATLNASSDALAYTLAHQGRLRRPAVVEALRSAPAHDTIGAYRVHIEEQVERLLFGELTIKGDARGARDEWHEALSGAISDEDAEECRQADGIHGVDLGQLAEGIELTLPHAFEWLEAHGGKWLEAFAESPHLWRRAPLAERLAAYVGQELPASPCAAWVAIGGAWTRVKGSARIDELGDEEGAFLVRNESAVRLSFDFDVLAHLEEEAPGEKSGEATELLVVSHHGEVLTLGLDAALVSFWQQLATGSVAMRDAAAALGEERVASLLRAGVVARFAKLAES